MTDFQTRTLEGDSLTSQKPVKVVQTWPIAASILSLESKQNVESKSSKTKNVESNTEKCGVQNRFFISTNNLF